MKPQSCTLALKYLGLQMLAGESNISCAIPGDLDWFCSVVTMAPKPRTALRFGYR